MNFSSLIQKLLEKESLHLEEMAFAMKSLMAGQVAEEEIVSFLTALRDKGESRDEIVAAAQVMREFSVKVSVHPDNLVDTCGTGGDNSGTFNLSTAAAFVVAGAGVRVAKHGNRAVSSQAGSADVLEALGVKIDLEPVQVRKCLVESGFGFFFAPRFHPAMKNVAAARKKIGTRTIFNLLGPLTNPTTPLAQVIGVYDRKKMLLLAEVLKDLGSRHVLLVNGDDGLDEVTLTGKTYIVELVEGKILETEIDPKTFGFEVVTPEKLKGKDAAHNAFLLKGILEGFEGSLRLAVLLNAAAAFVAVGRALSFEEGITVAEHSLDQGHAYQVLKDVIRISNE
ncbi:MAG: anthranilate phosphoribosyltransferase [Deltaproteobacteria bacterium]|nr:MAG: anthranilate phosphoribosyltransferase [Deltaproteobacteria bacterium]